MGLRNWVGNRVKQGAGAAGKVGKVAGKALIEEAANKIPGKEIVKVGIKYAAPNLLPQNKDIPEDLIEDLAAFRDKWAATIALNPTAILDIATRLFAKAVKNAD